MKKYYCDMCGKEIEEDYVDNVILKVSEYSSGDEKNLKMKKINMLLKIEVCYDCERELKNKEEI